MWRILSWLQKNLVWGIPVAMGAGLVYGNLFDAGPLKPWIIPVTFVMVYPMMVTLNFKSIFGGTDTRLQAATQAINFVLIPMLAYGIGKLFLGGAEEKYALWAVGLFLIGVLPTSGMTISWTGFARGNKEAAIKMVVFGLVLGSLAAPVYTKIFMGAAVEVDVLHMFQQIVLFVFVPLFAGLATQALGRRRWGAQVWQQQLQPKFPPFSALGVIMIAFVAMALKARAIVANPGDLLLILAPLAVFYLASYILLTVVGRLFFARGDAIAMVFGIVMRDLSIALAIAMTAFGPQGSTIALLIALAYVIQIQTAAWYVRLVDRLFGAPAPVAGVVEGPRPVAAPVPAAGPSMPHIGRILYATDLSETARHAVRYACTFADRFGAEVTLLHVVPDVLEEISAGVGINLLDHMDRKHWETFNRDGIGRAKEAIRQRIAETAAAVKDRMPACPLSTQKVCIEVGNPVEAIVRNAAEGGFDLVIMGTHGHGRVEGAVMGSVAAGVIRRCPVPVLVVRLPDPAPASEALAA
jgi:ACR3 family arsenite efflux pump ArsB/nucleotide-binding universal stress UspA family protein